VSVTLKIVGEAVEVLQVTNSLPEGQNVVPLTASDLKNLDRERLDEMDVQMPSFLRGDEDEDAEDLFHL
jgi:hypothetical protein